MSLKLRMSLKFDGNLIFREFLPEHDIGTPVQYRARKQAAAPAGNRLLTRAVLYQSLCLNILQTENRWSAIAIWNFSWRAARADNIATRSKPASG